MAGELQNTTAYASVLLSKKVPARLHKGHMMVGRDHHQFAAATELEAGDVLRTVISVPSNAIIDDILIYNDDMDTDGTPTVTLDVGVFAMSDFVSVTSGTETTHSKNAVVDADLFVDGSTAGQAATTNWTSLLPDSSTLGPEDSLKMVWELLGYDLDPQTDLGICVTSAAAATALAAAADFSIKVHYVVD